MPSTGRHYHWYISLINEASRANMLDFRTSNFQEAAIKPIVPRQGMPILKTMTLNYFFNFLDEWFESWHLTNEKKTGKRPTKCSEFSGVFQSVGPPVYKMFSWMTFIHPGITLWPVLWADSALPRWTLSAKLLVKYHLNLWSKLPQAL